jgi:hypothetical protein
LEEKLFDLKLESNKRQNLVELQAAKELHKSSLTRLDASLFLLAIKRL